MATISCEINEIISYLEKMRDKGYKTVEIIDYWRAEGWQPMYVPSIDFIVCKGEPKVLGIDMREYVKKK